MLDEIKELLTSRNEEKLISTLKANPALLDENLNGASVFVQLAYNALNDSFKAALELKKNFSFHEAIVAGRGDQVKADLEKNPSLKDEFSADGFPPLTLAAFFNHTDIAGILLKAGANPKLQASNPTRVNALHSAVARQNLALSKMLLEAGIDVNATQMASVTALHSAAHRGNMALVELLLQHGANPALRMEDGSTAADLAAKDGHPNVAEYLQRYKQGPSS